MKVYHEVAPNDLSAILAHGIIRTSRGDKGDEKYIVKTDQLLDSHRPQTLVEAGVSRDNNTYAYVCINGAIVSIVDGNHIPFENFVRNNTNIVLELNVDPNECFISDLDTYDRLKQALENHEKNVDPLCASYWHKVKKLRDFLPGSIRRPEIMITYDISPKDITRLN